MGGGILPATIIGNRIYFLFGKENRFADTPGWSDFAGGNESGETSYETALREGTEELTGILGSEKDLSRLLRRNGYFPLQYESYVTHLFFIEYDPSLTHYYNNTARFLQKRLPESVIKKSKLFEKAEISWFSYEDIKKKRSSFRPFYKNILDILLSKRKEIENKIFHIQKKKTRKHKIKKSRFSIKNGDYL
jgi:8-oxo-dGTP pyrophosphatase MutT (NUDIX family)